MDQQTRRPIQFFLDRADKTDPRKVSEMMQDVLGSASPIEFQTWDRGNKWLSGLSQLGPSATVPVGLGTNINPFFGTKIIPESRTGVAKELQFKKTTPKVTRELANKMGVAPARLEFVLNSFGGVPQDAQNLIDIATGAFGVEGREPEGITDTPFGTATKIPGVRKFLRETTEFGSPQSVKERKQLEEIQKGSDTEKTLIRDQAEEIWNQMNRLETKQQKIKLLDNLQKDGILTKEVRSKLDSIKKSRQSVGPLKKTTSVDVRARFILNKLNEMKASGVSVEDRTAYLDELEEAKILSSKTKKRISELKAGLN